jgi:hypothetical protein
MFVTSTILILIAYPSLPQRELDELKNATDRGCPIDNLELSMMSAGGKKHLLAVGGKQLHLNRKLDNLELEKMGRQLGQVGSPRTQHRFK